MKNQFLFLLFLLPSFIFAQVTSVDYFMKYNCETNQYDVHIEVLEGTANTIVQRAQFNSQVSIVVPTGESVALTESYMPLNDNQFYDGTTPLKWTIGTPVVAPEFQPENDFYGVTPTLAPASFYNDLQPGDVVKIFSFTAGETGQYDENVRFFNNDTDDDADPLGILYNFSNGFTLGGPNQLYNGHSEASCLTDVENQLYSEANIYPNPFQNQLTVEIPEGVNGISVMGANGELYYEVQNTNDRILLLNASDYPRGVFFVRLKYDDGALTSQRVVRL